MQADPARRNDSPRGDRSNRGAFGRLDILVINAAVKVSAETWDHTVDAGRKGAWLLARFAAKPDQLESVCAASMGGNERQP